ncbi:hypothetical protein ACIA5E_16610 [Nocardia asteroides]|uniref:hypothetical protein n=1 Tax=Nocardia asteroides TaxID=1824 RepID=UPI00379895E3
MPRIDSTRPPALPVPDGDPTAGITTSVVLHDNSLLVRLADPGLRRLCTCAAGLSPQAQWRLEAVAEALRNTEYAVDR